VVIGIGHDIVPMERIRRVLRLYGTRFTNRVFTESERAQCDKKPRPTACYAKRFAAKEACAKALGTGISAGLSWQDMRVTHDRRGKPALVLSTRAMDVLTRRQRHGWREVVLHLTLSDTDSCAIAFVLIEGIESHEPHR